MAPAPGLFSEGALRNAAPPEDRRPAPPQRQRCPVRSRSSDSRRSRHSRLHSHGLPRAARAPCEALSQ
eukprot:1313837-Heterocapsa_arctica.AAC.1